MGLWLGGEAVALSLSAFEVGWTETVLRQSEIEEGFLEEVLEAWPQGIDCKESELVLNQQICFAGRFWWKFLDLSILWRK